MPSPFSIRVRDVIRVRRYSTRTDKACIDWIKRYIRNHRMKRPEIMGATEVRRFLTWLTVERNVAAATQNQALNALIFLYREVLSIDPRDIASTVRAKKTPILPTAFTETEVMNILSYLKGAY